VASIRKVADEVDDGGQVCVIYHLAFIDPGANRFNDFQHYQNQPVFFF
jgi:DNA-binding HxlR family transcriptional regulator